MSRWLKACTAMLLRISVGRDVRLQVGKGQHQIGRERENFRNVGRGEGRDARLFAPHTRRPHRIAGDADNAVVLAEEIERLHGFFGQTDDSFGWIHPPHPSRQRSFGIFAKLPYTW